MGAGSAVRPRLLDALILVLLLLALLGGCAAASSKTTDGGETTGGETTGGEQTGACPQTTGGETTGGETIGGETTGSEQTSACPRPTGGEPNSGETTGEQTSACPQPANGSQATGGPDKQAAGPRVARRGSDLLRPSFVGEIQGTSAFIGIAFPGSTIPAEGPDEGMEVIVFITDGDPKEMGLRGAYGEWFRGTINEEGAIDSLESDLGVEIWGPVTERTSTGTVRFEEDAVFPYRADLVSQDTDAGLYRQEDEVEGIG